MGYSEPAPRGRRLGALEGGSAFEVNEVRAVRIPPDTHRGLPAQFGLAVRTESWWEPWGDCWINVTRAKARFADQGRRNHMGRIVHGEWDLDSAAQISGVATDGRWGRRGMIDARLRLE